MLGFAGAFRLAVSGRGSRRTSCQLIHANTVIGVTAANRRSWSSRNRAIWSTSNAYARTVAALPAPGQMFQERVRRSAAFPLAVDHIAVTAGAHPNGHRLLLLDRADTASMRPASTSALGPHAALMSVSWEGR